MMPALQVVCSSPVLLKSECNSHFNLVGLPSDSDGNADIAKQIPPNPLQHLNFEENVETQKEHKAEPDQIKIPKSRVSDLQKMKQSKLANITHFNISKSLFSFYLCKYLSGRWAPLQRVALEREPEKEYSVFLGKGQALMCYFSHVHSAI